MRKKRSGLVSLLMAIVILAVVGFFSYQWYLSYLESAVSKNAQVKAFVITQGESVSSIVERLKEEGFIRSTWVFKKDLKESGKETKVGEGDYKISANMTTREIVKKLTELPNDKWVTLIEGIRIEEMAKKLSDQLGIKSEDFLKAAKEGYMFPDTYLFNPDATGADIASILQNNFDKKYDSELQSKIKSRGLTAEQGVVLASLVEREGRSPKVRKEVAGIMIKRLKMGMKLDIDSTVQYAKDSALFKAGKITKFWQPITLEEYASVKSPYNTYLNNGLPPGPICNPSLVSLQAVAEADANTPYLYYYHDSKGDSYYARTLEEHNANISAHP